MCHICGTARLFSKAAPFYIFTSDVWGFHSPHLLVNTYFVFLFGCSHPSAGVVSLWSWFAFPQWVIEHSFTCLLATCICTLLNQMIKCQSFTGKHHRWVPKSNIKWRTQGEARPGAAQGLQMDSWLLTGARFFPPGLLSGRLRIAVPLDEGSDWIPYESAWACALVLFDFMLYLFSFGWVGFVSENGSPWVQTLDLNRWFL